MSAREIELKLAAGPRTLERIAADPLFEGLAGRGERLEALYYDSPAGALWRRGIVLRVRREGGHWIQSVKLAGGARGGAHRRIELEQPLADARPDLVAVPDAEIAARIARALGRAALVPAFRVEVERRRCEVSPSPGVRIEVALDRGAIRAGRRRAVVSEVELELREGGEADLYAFALELAGRHLLRLDPRSKAERGYALAAGAEPPPRHAPLGVVRRGARALEALQTVGWHCLAHFEANLTGARAGRDPEYLHQVRVALRRLNAALRVFGPLFPEGASAQPLASLRAVARALGPARDWDVFAAELLAAAARRFPGHRGLHALVTAVARLRARTHNAARRAIGSRRTTLAVLGFARWLAAARWLEDLPPERRATWHGPVRPVARAMLERAHRRVLRRGRRIARRDAAQLHRLRIAAKRLRYAAGFFAPVFGRAKAEPMLRVLGELQDLLGELNDCTVAPAMLAETRRLARGPLVGEACDMLEHWLAARAAQRRRRLAKQWKAFRRAPSFWREAES